MPKKPDKKEEEDKEFQESLQRMVKVGTVILNTSPGKGKPVLHKKKPKTEAVKGKPAPERSKRGKVKAGK